MRLPRGTWSTCHIVMRALLAMSFLLLPACCQAKTLSPLRSETMKMEAQLAVKNSSNGGGSVYFKHLRKAGGTTVRAFLKKVYDLKHEEGKELYTSHHSEFPFFSYHCLSVSPLTVYITSLRDPIERAISLYYYDGPGKQNPESSVEEWHDWLNAGTQKLLENATLLRIGAAPGAYSYLQNYATHSLTQSCSVVGPAMCGKDNQGQDDKATPGCHLNPKNVDTVQLELAKEVVRSFDITLVVEHFGLRGVSVLLQRTLGVKHIWLEHKNSANRLKKPKRHILESVRERIRLENLMDTQLHQYAAGLLSSRLKQLQLQLQEEGSLKEASQVFQQEPPDITDLAQLPKHLYRSRAVDPHS